MKAALLVLLVGVGVGVYMTSSPPSLDDYPRLVEWASTGVYHNYKGHPVFVKMEPPTVAEWTQGDDPRPVLLLLHGFPTCTFDWHPLWSSLAQSFRLVAPDSTGHGLSFKQRHLRDHLTMTANADIADHLLSTLGVSSYHILAHDYGDSVAQELLARHATPDSSTGVTVESVVFLNGGILPGEHHPLLIQSLLASPNTGPFLRKLVVRPSFDRSFSKVFGPHTKPSAAVLDEYWALYNHNNGLDVVDLVLRYMHERVDNKHRWEDALRNATCDIVLVNGALDPISGIHVVKAFEAMVAEAGQGRAKPSVVLHDVGHYPVLEAPERVYTAVADFHGLHAPYVGPHSGL